MWPWLPSWLTKLWTPAAKATPQISAKLLAVQAAMLTGAFAMGGATHAALQRSTFDAQTALNTTSGEDGAIEAIRTIGMANMEARGTLRAESHPNQPLEHRATYAILEHQASVDRNDPAAVQATFARKRDEVLRALQRTYYHERLQLEALVPQDDTQRELIAQRLSELDSLDETTVTLLGEDGEASLLRPEPGPAPEAGQAPKAQGLRQVLTASLTAEPDTVAAQPDTVATQRFAAQPDTVVAPTGPVFAQADAEDEASPLVIDRALGD